MDEIYHRHQIQTRAKATADYLMDNVRARQDERRDGRRALPPAEPDNFKDFQA